jgi:hypothetical protein
MKRICTIASCLLIAVTTLNAQTHKPAPKFNPHQATLKSLVGRVLYACSPASSLVKRYIKWPDFYLIGADGKPTMDKMDTPFPFGTILTITGADSDLKPDAGQQVNVTINLLAQSTGQKVIVELVLGLTDVLPARIFNAVAGSAFSTHKVRYSPYVGEPEHDMYCSEGSPDHVNSDAIGSDQLVYWGGDRLIYIGQNGRVEDIEESY